MDDAINSGNNIYNIQAPKLTNRDMRLTTMWHFDMKRLRRACAASF